MPDSSGAAVLSHNVNLYDLKPEYHDWLEAKGFPARYFVDVDGGGAHHFTIEFQARGHALAFLRHFGFKGGPYPWGEKKKSEGWQSYALENVGGTPR